MSTTIDQRVVEMQFDNKHFEQNVQTSISTLDKLKQSLKLDDAAKGFDNVSSAAKKVDMSGLGNAVENVRTRFSALEVMGVTALANITNSAVNAGKRMLSALTIQPITTGFKEYELKMDSIKTIMASTGESVETVNKYLNELNEYSDQTIYSFADMTQNIGKFTNAGVKLEDAVLAIKGISNEAAVSGANANEASRAMYNFAQALSAGYVKLIDWKSIENANMATVEFKQQLIDTAVELGTVKKAADGMYKTLDGHDFNATKNFNDVLKDQWMTTDVLVTTLGKYADKTTEIGKKAFAAAQDVTKFSQVWDILKETAQSGWARTWELIIGDIEQAKALLTPFTNFLSKIVQGINDARNNLLGGALNGGSLWKSISSKFEKSGIGKMLNGIENISGKVNKAKHSLEEFQGIVNKVWRGDYGNHDVVNASIDRFRRLDADGWYHRVVQDLVNKGHGYKITMADVEASHKKFGLTMEQTAKTTEDAGDAIDKTANSVVKLTDEQLRNAGLTDEEIKLYRDLEAEAKRTGKTIDEIAQKMSEKDGRTLLVESFKNAGQGLVAIFTAIKDAWREIFPPMSTVRLYSIIESINKFSQHLRVSDETADKLKRTLKGVFAVFNLITFFVGGAFRIAFKVISTILGAFDLNILDLTAMIGDAIVAFVDWIKTLFDFEGLIKKVAGLVVSAVKAVKRWFEVIRDSGAIQKFTEWVVKSVKALSNWFAGLKDTKAVKNVLTYIKNAWKSIKKWFAGMKNTDDLPKYIFDGICRGLKSGMSAIGGVLKYIGKFIFEAIKKIPGMSEWFDSLKESDNIALDIILGLVKGLGSGLSMIWNAAVKLATTLWEAVKEFLGIHSPSTKFIEIGKYIIEGLIEGIRWGVSVIMDTFGAVIEPVIEWLKSLDWSFLLAAGLAIGAVWFLKQIGDFVGGIGRFMDSARQLTKSMKKVGDSLSLALKAEAAKAFATAVLILVGAIAILTLLDQGKMWSAVGALAVVMGLLIGLTIAMSKTAPEALKGVAGFAGLIAALALAMLALAGMAKILSGISWPDLGKAGLAILALGGLVVGLVFLAKYIASNYKTMAAIAKIGDLMIKIGASFLLFAVTLRIISGMSEDDVKRSLSVIVLFGGIVAGLMAMTKLIGGNEKSIANIGKTLMSIGVTFLLMAATIAIVNNMSTEEIVKGLLVITAFSAIIVGLMAATRLAAGGKAIQNAGKVILGVGVAMLLMGLALRIVGGMSPEDIAKGEIAIAGFAAIITGLIAATRLAGGEKNMRKLGKTLLMASAAIAILAIVAMLLSLVDGKALAKGVAAVAALGAVVAGLMYASKFAKNCTGTIVVMLIAIAGMAGILYAMSALEVENALVNAAALSAVMLAMTTCLKMMGKMNVGKKGGMKNMLTAILMLTAMVIPMGAFAAALWLIPDLSNKIGTIAALTAVVIAMTAILPVLAAAGKIGGAKALWGVLALTLMAVPLLAFGATICLLGSMNFGSHIENILMSLVRVMAAMTLLLIPLGIIGALYGITGGTAFLGIVALTAMIVPLLAFGVALWALDAMDIGKCMGTVNVLVVLMNALTDVLVKVSLVAPLAVVAVGAIAGLAAVILTFGLIGGAICGLLGLIPGIEDFLAKGIDIMVMLAGGIGEMIGAFVGGIIDGVVGSLPGLGEALSSFMMNAEYFITKASEIDSSLVDGVGALALAIIALCAADLIDSITSFLGFGSSFEDLGTKLSKFMENVLPAFANLEGIDPEMIKCVGILADALLTLTSTELLDQLSSFLPGDDASFGDKLVSLADGMKAFGEACADLNKEQIMMGCECLDLLIALSERIPEASWYEKLCPWSKNDEGVFGQGLEQLASGLLSFSNSAAEVNLELVDKGIAGVEKLLALSEKIPDASWYEKVIPWSSNDEGVFGEGLEDLGAGLKSFSDSATGVDIEAVEKGVGALTTLVTLSESIPAATWYEKICPWSSSDEGVFGDGLAQLGEGLASFATSTTGIDAASVQNAATALGYLVGLDVPDAEWFAQLCPWSKSNEQIFGQSLGDLGAGLAAFYTAVSAAGLEPDLVNKAATALGYLVGIDVPDAEWFAQLCPWASSNEKVFGQGLGDLGAGLAAFYKAITNGITMDPELVNNAATALGYLVAIKIPEAGFFEKLGVVASDEQVFAKGLKALGSGLKGFYTTVAGENYSADKMQSAINALNTCIDLIKKTPPSTDTVSKWSNALKQLGIGVKQFYDNAKVMPSSLSTSVERLAKAATMFTNMDTSKMSDFGAALKKIAEANVEDLITVCDAYAEKMETVGSDMVKSFAAGVSDNVSTATKAIETLIEDCIDSAEESASGMKSAGKDLGDGLVEGINAKQKAVYEAGYALGQKAVQGEKDGQKSKSPSRLTIQAGKWLGEGLVIGMEQMSRSVYNAGHDLGGAATNSISRTISRVADMVNTDIDSQPTIRPVLDLSDVKTGAGLIDGLLNTGSVIGVSANVGSINSMMNNRLQNGVNDDVVSAIDKLRGDLGNIGNTSYNINGITYDDGSNIASAVETLIRAARIERRV